MALPWLAIIARTVPWAELVRRTPGIIAASRELLDGTRQAKADAKDDRQHAPDLQKLNDRIDALEQRDEAHAKVVAQMVEQLQRITDGLEVLAARNRLLAWLIGILTAFVIALIWFI